MSNKAISVLGVLAAGLGLLAGTTQGCGGGNSSASFTDTCNMVCDKEASCNPQFAAGVSACKNNCASSASDASTSTSVMNSCPNMSQDQVIAKANSCIAGSCTALLGCLESICPSGNTGADGGAGAGMAGTTGAGTTGTSGAGTGVDGAGTAGTVGAAGAGTGGAGGAGGSASGGTTCDTACTKADACCLAATAGMPDAGQACMFEADCVAAGANTSSVVMLCNQLLQSEANLGPATPAACK